jgi:hypothetical protein
MTHTSPRPPHRWSAPAVAMLLMANPVALHAITSAKCARKCNFATAQCAAGQSVTQCGPALERSCVDAVEQSCRQAAVAACLTTNGKSCKRPRCRILRDFNCPCLAAGVSPKLCHVPRRCRKNSVECPTATLCCTIQVGSICVVAGQETCASDDPACASNFRAACATGTVQEIPNGLSCAAVTGCQ